MWKQSHQSSPHRTVPGISRSETQSTERRLRTPRGCPSLCRGCPPQARVQENYCGSSRSVTPVIMHKFACGFAQQWAGLRLKHLGPYICMTLLFGEKSAPQLSAAPRSRYECARVVVKADGQCRTFLPKCNTVECNLLEILPTGWARVSGFLPGWNPFYPICQWFSMAAMLGH